MTRPQSESAPAAATQAHESQVLLHEPGRDLPWLAYHDGGLHLEGVALADLAERHGTPCYAYSSQAMVARYRSLRDAFGSAAHICYAVKACSNLSVLRQFDQLGCGFDLVSGGELARLRTAGIDPSGAVFAGVGKQAWEVRDALAADIRFFNVETPFELSLLSQAGAAAGKPVPVALRLNPDVDPGAGHAYIRTGKDEDKFGLGLEAAAEAVRQIAADEHLQLVGYHVHLGSLIRTVQPYLDAFAVVAGFMDADPLHRDGVRYYDMGGGFGVSYGHPEGLLEPGAVATALLPKVGGRHLELVLEPGRYLMADAGLLLVRVLGTKPGRAKRFVLVDGAMNDLMRPALYQADHPVVPVSGRDWEPDPLPADVVGPVCESGDFLARGRSLPAVERGDLLAVLSTGAYGLSMASNYNSRCRPPEVLVTGAMDRVIRSREDLSDLWRHELAALPAELGEQMSKDPQ